MARSGEVAAEATSKMKAQLKPLTDVTGKTVKGLGAAAKGLGTALGVAGVAYQAYDILGDATLSLDKRGSELGGAAAETALSFNPYGMAATAGRTAASLGARALGKTETADWIDENLKLTKLTDPLGDTLGAMYAKQQELIKDFTGINIYELLTGDKTALAKIDTSSSSQKQATPGQAAKPTSASEPGGVTTKIKATTLTTNPDGSVSANFTLTMPGFNDSVYSAMNKYNSSKPTG
jgi:hypothetical protein